MRKLNSSLLSCTYFFLILVLPAAAQDWARRPSGEQTRWSSFENLKAAKGSGGMTNQGAKGYPMDTIAAGETKTLLDVQGPGEIRRIWLTVSDRTPRMLRGLRLEMFWDGAAQPAVSVPMGDFFGAILGKTTAFENELFASPEGRSFVATIPMPFRKGARVTLTNDSGAVLRLLFFDVNVLMKDRVDPNLLYFHAIWRRENPTKLAKDFEILPRVEGVGRFLGTHIGVIANARTPGWWGEGEVKVYLDGDSKFPTLTGTGTEDYIGTGWGQGKFQQRFQGSLVADRESGEYGFYRYHIPDPVYFYKDIRVTIQQMGGATYEEYQKIQIGPGAEIRPVTAEANGKLVRLLEPGEAPLEKQPLQPNSWVNFYRQDDVSAVALFYLDRPTNGLPPLAPPAARLEGMTQAQPE
ncbi:MAG: DUF2961 domain-containing protein [Bryobacterales bacterium]|nr:DUF2961 domain-containing protein [Bryobacterales bacterium]